MIWTDPPYGVAIGDKEQVPQLGAPEQSQLLRKPRNDTLASLLSWKCLRGAFKNAAAHCLAGGAWYGMRPEEPLCAVWLGIEKL